MTMQKLLIATSLLFTACHNPNYCAGNPDNNCNETGGSNDGGIDGNESISCVNTGCCRQRGWQRLRHKHQGLRPVHGGAFG